MIALFWNFASFVLKYLLSSLRLELWPFLNVVTITDDADNANQQADIPCC